MTKDNKVNIKIEVCRDKTSGKLIMMAHFNSNAPNVFIDKGNYSWMPTPEEHGLINEAFEFLPADGPAGTIEKVTPELPKEKVEELKPEPPQQEAVNEEEEKPEELPALEKAKEPAVFEITEDEPKSEEFEKEIDEELKQKEEKPALVTDEKPIEPPGEEQSEDKNKGEDDGILVEADQDAIERALKKHKDEDGDDSIVEVDEQMIIDKVLSQKKKGKWVKK